MEAAHAFLRPEDQAVAWKVDGLGRSLREMLVTAHKLQLQAVKLRSLTEAVDTETPTGRLMFAFLATVSEYFLDLNRERTIEGLRAAASRGRKGGRRCKLSEDDLAVARAPQRSKDLGCADRQAAGCESGHTLHLSACGTEPEFDMSKAE